MMKRIFSLAAAALVLAGCCSNAPKEAEAEAQTTDEKALQYESERFLSAETMGWQQLPDGTERQVMGYNDDIMIVKVRCDAGEVGAIHSHPHTQVTYIISGAFDFTVAGETRTVKAGDCIYVAPNLDHGFTCVESGCLTDCFSPMRETFVTK